MVVNGIRRNCSKCTHKHLHNTTMEVSKYKMFKILIWRICYKWYIGNFFTTKNIQFIRYTLITHSNTSCLRVALDYLFQHFLGSGDYPQWPAVTTTDIPIWIVIGAIVAILLVGFILVDLACFKINRQGKSIFYTWTRGTNTV